MSVVVLFALALAFSCLGGHPPARRHGMNRACLQSLALHAALGAWR
jgi:hypothetical protein